MTTIPDSQLHAYAHRVKGKTVVITGGANGFGKETALLFSKFGGNIVIGDIDVKGGNALVSKIQATGGKAAFAKCDVTNWDEQVAMFELGISKFGSVDVVIANAGVVEIGQFDVVKLSNGKPVKPILKTVEINLVSVLYTTHLSLHYLKVNRTSDESFKSLVLLGSMASWCAIPGGSLYAASKHGVLGLMRSQYPLLAGQGIRIACIHPFFADTAIVPTVAKVFLAGIPLTPVDRVAGTVFNAATDPSEESNGASYVLLDDGPLLRLEREQLKEGVYGMMDRRAKALLATVGKIRRTVIVIRDLNRAIGKPVLTLALSIVAARYGWIHRANIAGLLGKN